MNPYIIVGLLVAWGSSLAGTGWWFYNAGEDHQIAKTVEQSELIRAVSDAAQHSAATAIAGIVVKNTTIKGEIEREIRTNTVYADCRHSPEQLRRLNEALTGRAEPAGGGQLPRADANGR